MQFVENGPDVPDRLIEAHEDGRVVFFCGAGISYPAGLPTFKGLVEKIYQSLGETQSEIEKSAFDSGLLDTTLGLLEGRIVGGRTALRRKLAEALEPNYSLPAATTMHEALLTLARGRDQNGGSKGKFRLITTNFDRIFERLRDSGFSDCRAFSAPLLPIPKQRWDGLVYLHGLLPAATDEHEFDRLVVTSGDFGLAYLSERWAARFVSELFRTFSICFVGYSLNDPILRYMRDALAADAQLGESPIEAFAFGGVRRGQEAKDEREWRAKNVTPILYPSAQSHVLLQNTLKEWAGVYRDGISGKERIVAELAPYLPTMSTVQDDPIGRLIWALVDRSGIPARKFAELDPLPPIEWLAPLAERRFGHAELTRFSVMPNRDVDEQLRFSVVVRPSPYRLAPPMHLVGRQYDSAGWDEVMNHLGRWLARHLDKSELVLWVAKEGGQVHQFWRGYIEAELRKNAVPAPYRIIWSLILAGRVVSGHRGMELLGWINRWKQDGFSSSLRFELRALLSPMIELDERWSAKGETGGERPTRVSEVVNGEVVLATQHPRSLLTEVRKADAWFLGLAELLDDFVYLLNDAVELKRQLDDGEYHRRSYLDLPSIEEHSQNSYRRDWIILVDLCRDSWLSLAKRDPASARQEARKWIASPHALFRRLALFAATQGDVIEVKEALDWLLADDRLWAIDTQREAIRLTVALVPRLTPTDQSVLEKAILSGPPLSLYGKKQHDVRSRRIRDHEIWLRLSKLENAGAVLTRSAITRLRKLGSTHPNWKLAHDDRDEFPSWVGDATELRVLASPKTGKELANWLREHPNSGDWEERDDWSERCRIDFPRTASALLSLSNAGHWPSDRWKQALQAWTEERLAKLSWRWLGDVLVDADNEFLQKLGHSLSSWLQGAGKFASGSDSAFFELVLRVLSIHRDDADESARNDYVSQAINHPVGHVTEAALLRWYQSAPKDEQLLPKDLHQVLTLIANPNVHAYRHGRVILGAHVIALFRVDPDWTAEHLLPLFNWSGASREALSVWQGFLWSPRFYIPLVAAIRSSFLETAEHFLDLADFGQGYASMLALAGLEPRDLFSNDEIRDVVHKLPTDGLEKLASAVLDFQKAAGDTRADYWINRTAPFLMIVWPKSSTRQSVSIGMDFARISIASGTSFPDAFAQLRDWMQRSDQSGLAIVELESSGHCTHFPDVALRLLDAIVEGRWPSSSLKDCLEEIAEADPKLTSSPAYIRLSDILKAVGRG